MDHHQQSTYGTTGTRRRHHQQHEYAQSSYIDVGRIGAESMGLGRDFFEGKTKKRVKFSGRNSPWLRGGKFLYVIAFVVVVTGCISLRSVQSLRMQREQLTAESSTMKKAQVSSKTSSVARKAKLAEVRERTSANLSEQNMKASVVKGESKGEGLIEGVKEVAIDVMEDLLLDEAQPKETVKTSNGVVQETSMKTVLMEAASPAAKGGKKQKNTRHNRRHRPLPRGTTEEAQVVVTKAGEPAPKTTLTAVEKTVKEEAYDSELEEDKSPLPKPKLDVDEEKPHVPKPLDNEPDLIEEVVDESESTSAAVESDTADTASVSRNAAANNNGHSKKWEPIESNPLLMISGVATIALLVGAVSARKLRSKPFMSDCIENESLEDDLAYDTENTFGGMVGQYGSFSAPWKGDLEKFDV